MRAALTGERHSGIVRVIVLLLVIGQCLQKSITSTITIERNVATSVSEWTGTARAQPLAPARDYDRATPTR